jgi:pimeloyl-ACP methyl ester carboxylesterase
MGAASSPAAPIELLLALLAGLALGFSAWIGLALWLVRRFRIPDDASVESLCVPLPTPGHNIGLSHYPPTDLGFKEPVLVCHGLAVNRFNMDFYADGKRGLGSDRVSIVRALRRAGFDVWLLELRGRGRAACPPGDDWNVDDEVDQDVPTAIQTVLDLTGSERLFWVGHSKGGILQMLFQAKGEPPADRVAGVVAIGTAGTVRFQPYLKVLLPLGRVLLRVVKRIPLRMIAVPFLPLAGVIHLFGRRFDAAIAANDGTMIRRILATIPADIAGGVARQMMSWVASSDGAIRSHDGSFNYEEHYSRIKVPLLLFAGLRDPLAPPRAVEFIKDRVASTDLTLKLMSRANGASADYGHGDLVVGRHAPDDVFPVVVDWLQKRATRVPGGPSGSE